MTNGQKHKLREVMAICNEASIRATQKGNNFNAPQALIYSTISLAMHWVMAVLDEEPHNELFKRFEQVIANAKQFGVTFDPLKDLDLGNIDRN